MVTGGSNTANTVCALLFGLSALMAAASANAEIYRFPGTFLIELGTAVADKEVHDDGGVTYRWSKLDVASWLPTEMAFVFDSDRDLLFPDVITSVFAVKPKGGGIENVLIAPMAHQGGGEYRFQGSTGHDVTAWFEVHGKEMVAGNVVLQQIGGLYDALAEMNRGTAVTVSSRFMFAGREITTRDRKQPPRFTTGPHRELKEAIEAGGDLPDWYLEQLGPQMRARVTEIMNERNERTVRDRKGAE